MGEQVLVTGISGFIAQHIALDLLRRGYAVRGTVRNSDRIDDVRNLLQKSGADVSLLSFAEADLTSDANWREATTGCRYVQHVAAPFPIKQPRDREALVPAARGGALRVLQAAKETGAERVVFTSSMVTMMYRSGRPEIPETFSVSEDDWTDPEWKELSPYMVAKTRAEKAAWDWARKEDWSQRMTVVNPGFVLGPSLDTRLSTSVQVIQMILQGAYPAIPPVTFPVVDVRDLAALHVEAMTKTEAGGRRLVGAGDSMSLEQMASVLRDEFPEHAKKIPSRRLPAALARFISIFDRSLRSITPDLNVWPIANSGYVSDMTGISFRPAEDAVKAAADSLIGHRLV